MAAPSTHEFEASDRKLRRELSFQQLLFFNVGGIIGSGWLFAVLAASSIAGPAVVFSWLIGGLLILLVALNYAEIAGAIPRSGAIARYPHLTHGGYTGLILAWSYFLSAVAVPPIEAEGVITYASTYWKVGLTTTAQHVTILTPLGIVLAVILMIVFFFVNYFGVKLLGRFNQIFTWWKLVIPVLTFILLFFAFRGSNFTKYGGFIPLGVNPVFLAISTGGIVFAYLGFRQGLDYGGEAKDPQHDVPRATIISVILATVVYILLQLSFTGAMDWSKVGVPVGHWSALAHSTWSKGPLYDALSSSGIALLGAFASLLLVDAFISPSGTGWIYLGTTTRVLYGMGMQSYLPRPLTWISRYQIPWVALLGSLVVGILFFLPLPSWYLLVGFITGATVLTMITSGITLEVLRRTAGDLQRPFRLRASAILAPAGTVAAVLVVYWSGFTTLTEILAAVFVGLPLYSIFYAPSRAWLSLSAGLVIGLVFLVAWIVTEYLGPMSAHLLPFWLYFALILVEVAGFGLIMWALSDQHGKHTVQSSWWLIFNIFAVYALSFLGQYGPFTKPPIAFPYDTIIAIAIGLVTFYWAVAAGYETEEVRAIVESGSGLIPEEPETPLAI